MSLVLLQAGLLFYIKNLKDGAANKLVRNTTKVDIECGRDLYSDLAYWDLLNDQLTEVQACQGPDCSMSSLAWEQKQDKDLHILSVLQAPPIQWDKNQPTGGIIDVTLKPSPEDAGRPQVLALVSKNNLQWNLKLEDGVRLEKVIVATPEFVWIEGLPEDTSIEYLPREKMCSYPYAWQEAFNPDNQLRSLLLSLRKVSGLKETSFHGAIQAEEFVVGGVAASNAVTETQRDRTPASLVSQPVTWKRDQGFLVAEQFEFLGVKYPLADKTKNIVVDEKQKVAFALIKGLVHEWSTATNEFQVMDTPLAFDAIDWALAMAYDAESGTLYIFNDERSGELYSYQVKDKKWQLLNDGVSKSLQALYFDTGEGKLVGLVRKGTYFSHLVDFDSTGKVLKTRPLEKMIPFDKRRWRWSLSKSADRMQVRLASLVRPAGETIPLSVSTD